MPMGWHKADIRAAVEKKGKTLTQLALDSGLDPTACSVALLRPWAAPEKVIAAFVGVPLWELWPRRWNVDGTRIDNRFKDQPYASQGWA